MEHGSETSKLALNWFLGAGIAAIFFSLFLVWSDRYLTSSNAEQEKAAIIAEMRKAQHSMPLPSTDQRSLVGLSCSAGECSQ